MAARRVRTSSPVPSGGARTPERRACHIGACGPQALASGIREAGCPCARAPLPAGAAPDPGRVLVIVDRYCPRAGSNDPRSCLTGFGPAGSQSVARWAGTGSNARHGNHTFSMASMIRRRPESWQGLLYGGGVRRGASHRLTRPLSTLTTSPQTPAGPQLPTAPLVSAGAAGTTTSMEDRRCPDDTDAPAVP